MSPIEEIVVYQSSLSPTICLCHWGSKSDLVVMCDAVLCLDSVNSIPFLVTWNKLFRCESYKLWMQMMCEGVGEFESLIRLFVCTNVQLIVVCLFFITYLFTLTSAFYTIFCRLTRMFFSQCAAGFLFYYGKKIQRQTMCVYVFNGYASVSVLCVLLCLNFWRSVGVEVGGRGIFLYDMRMKSIRSMLVCCSAAFSPICYYCCFCCYSFG